MVQLPENLRRHAGLREDSGRTVDLQVDAQGMAAFIAPALAKRQSKVYRLMPAAPDPAAPPAVQSMMVDSRARLQSRDMPPIFLQTHPGQLPREAIPDDYRRGSYLHPVHSPSGRRVTDDYPANHLHHHGIWFAWTKTTFNDLAPDFWNMGQRSGTVEFVAVDAQWNGAVHAGIKTRNRYRELITPDQATVLHETWTVRAYAFGPGEARHTLFDVEIVQTCATPAPLLLPKYYYGGMGFRGHWDWNGRGRTSWLTSEGETDPVKGNETRGRWCYIGGRVDGQQSGIAILCHPDNDRAPQPMRLHPSEPFFCFAPQQLGPMEITPDRPYASQYRFVVMDGPPDRHGLDQLYEDYARPPQVTVTPAP
jgi:hypothetical protein